MEARLIGALKPTIYWLVLFSIFVHGLSIPLLSIVYKLLNVPPEVDTLGPAEVRPLSFNQILPPNSLLHAKRRSILVYNRFSRSKFPSNIGWDLPHFRSNNSSHATGHVPLMEEFPLQSVHDRHKPESTSVV